MKRKTFYLTLLLFLCSCKQNYFKAMEEAFPNIYNDKNHVEMMGIGPCLDKQEEIYKLNEEAGYKDCNLDLMGIEGSQFIQESYLWDVNDSIECRCTCFALLINDEVNCAWIETSAFEKKGLQIPKSIMYFRPDTTKEEIITKYKLLFPF